MEIINTIKTLLGIEFYKSIPGFDGLYKISTHGNILKIAHNLIINHMGSSKIIHRCQHKYLSIQKRKNQNYLATVNICYNNNRFTFTLSKLLALTFIPNPDNKPFVMHKDGNILNNNLKNLQWATQKEIYANEIRLGKLHQFTSKQKSKQTQLIN